MSVLWSASVKFLSSTACSMRPHSSTSAGACTRADIVCWLALPRLEMLCHRVLGNGKRRPKGLDAIGAEVLAEAQGLIGN